MKKSILIGLILFTFNVDAQVFVTSQYGIGMSLGNTFANAADIDGGASFGPIYIGVGASAGKDYNIIGEYYSTIGATELSHSHWTKHSEGDRVGELLYVNVGVKLYGFLTIGGFIGSCTSYHFINAFDPCGSLGNNGWFNICSYKQKDTYRGLFALGEFHVIRLNDPHLIISPYIKLQYANIGGIDLKFGLSFTIYESHNS